MAHRAVGRDGPVVVADDARDDGEAEAAALGFGGEARDEQVGALLGGEAEPGVGDRDLERRALARISNLESTLQDVDDTHPDRKRMAPP